jgi:phosphopantothenoylcysteine decarboxylase / phosphopantothenate---cysteine ligase
MFGQGTQPARWRQSQAVLCSVAVHVRAEANPLAGKTVLVAVCGGIAAYKAAELVRLLVQAGATVRAAMTAGARQFLGPLTLQTLTGAPVATDLFDLTQESEIGHIRAADGADLVVVAPATADSIARFAAGRADDVVSAIILATRAPVLLAPAMNVNMWEHPATQHSVHLLRQRGLFIVGPGEGFLACRWTGPGRLAEPADIVEAACRIVTPQDLADVRVVVSAGPTYEPIDPVRYIGNRSSGRMGHALAAAASRRGARVHLVSGPTSVEAPAVAEITRIRTAQAMYDAVLAAYDGADMIIMAAAVADFRPAEQAAHKIKKSELAGGRPAPIELVANPDILAELGRRRGSAARPLLIGFAAETHDVVEYATDKLQSKGCDLIVANDVSRPDAGFDVPTNRVVVVGRGAPVTIELASKDEVAHRILDHAVACLGETAKLAASGLHDPPAAARTS